MSDQPTALADAQNAGIDRIPSEKGIAVLRNMRDYTLGSGSDTAREILYVIGQSGAFFSPENREKLSYRTIWEKGARSLMDPGNIADTHTALGALDAFKNIICAAANEDGVEDALRTHIETVTAKLKEGLTDANRGERVQQLLGDAPEAEARGAARFINPKKGDRGRGGTSSLVLRARQNPDRPISDARDES